MKKDSAGEETRSESHNMSWKPSVWTLADELAFHYRLKGGVSQLIEELVLEELSSPRLAGSRPEQEERVRRAKELLNTFRKRPRDKG